MQQFFKTEEELVLAIKSTDMNERDRALKQLYKDSVVIGKLRDLLSYYNLPHLELNEILQEGIILLDDLVRTHRFRGDSSVRTFLISICRNIMRQGMGKVSRVVLKDDMKEAESIDEVSADSLIILHEKSEAEEQREHILQTLISQITEGCQEVIKAYYFKAFSMAQIAAQRGLANAEQAKKATHRCREQLRNLILGNPQLAQHLKNSLI